MKILLSKIHLAALLFVITIPQVSAQQTRHFKEQFKPIGNNENGCWGFVTFDATFTGFASRMTIKNTQLYIVNASSNLADAFKKQGVDFQYHSEIGTRAYKVPRFTLYLQGYTSIGKYHYNSIYSVKPFELQLSDALGDYTTPEFKITNKSQYSGENSWENSGDLADYPTSPAVSEIYFKDYNIRIK